MKDAKIFLFIFIVIILTCQVPISNSKKSGKKNDSSDWDKAHWINEAIGSVRSGRYPNIKAISYWHERWENDDESISDLRINSSKSSLNAYRTQISDSIFTSTPEFDLNDKLIAPSNSKIYIASFPFFGNEEDVVLVNSITDFENLAGKPITWAYFSNNWLNGIISFPQSSVEIIHNAGRVPFIRMMMRSEFETVPDPVYTLQKIISGIYDTELKQWADNAKSIPYPLLLEFGTEVNGDWFAWNGRWNGGSVKTGYGDPNVCDGPERFVDTYRHIIDIFNAEGVNNVTWFFHVDVNSSPDESWNNARAYYPGDAYIDWLGVSVYGPIEPDEDYESFVDLLDGFYPELLSISSAKPIAVLEFGITEPE
jgi:hypothetical protein